MKEFIQKLVEIQGNLKAPKGQRNSFGNYNYRSCEDILEAVKPLLRQHGMVLTIADKMVQVSDRVYVEATATITDGESSISNTASAREALTKKGMDDSQITGAASSYARKYALNGLFCIDDTKDADATNDHGVKPSEHYQWAQLLVAYMSNGDSSALLDEWESKDQDFQGEAWKHIQSTDRKAVKDMISAERTIRAGGA